MTGVTTDVTTGVTTDVTTDVTTTVAAAWSPPPDQLALAPDEVHVWRVRLAQPPDQLAILARTLAPDERTRAARFHFERDRTAYTSARGALRTLTGGYLGVSPAELVFAYQAKGKPYLAAAPQDLRFNVSHSGDFALLAFTLGREVGVDVERRRALNDLLSLAKLSFSAPEYATLCSLLPVDQLAAFFTCWARKEAFIKATGEGISQLGDFEVSLRPGEPARLIRVAPVAPAAPAAPAANVANVAPAHHPWSIHDLPAIPDHAAALVVARPAVRICCWDHGWAPA